MMSGEMPRPRSSLTECWVGLLFGSFEPEMNGTKRYMDEQAVAAADLGRYLADGLEERLRLDVAGGAADLGDDDVSRGLCRPSR